MTTFFGFAISDSMFNDNVTITREVMTLEEVRHLLNTNPNINFCLNPSHRATIIVALSYGLNVIIPPVAPIVSLSAGDSLIVMGVRGLPRLVNRHEYNDDEIANATFTFSRYTVL